MSTQKTKDAEKESLPEKNHQFAPGVAVNSVDEKAPQLESMEDLHDDMDLSAQVGDRRAGQSKSKLFSPPKSEEVWFTGCHSDVGGGSVSNRTRHSLSRIPLRWMIRECFACDTGIIFDADILRERIGLDTTSLYPVFKPRDGANRIKPMESDHISECSDKKFFLWELAKFIVAVLAIPLLFIFRVLTFPVRHLWILLRYSYVGHLIREQLFPQDTKNVRGGRHTRHDISWGADLEKGTEVEEGFVSEELEDFKDALRPIHDELKLAWMWWIVEILPFRFRNQAGPRDDFYVRYAQSC